MKLLRRFWSKLAGRHVVRVAVAYAVVAWVVIQVASDVFPALGLPEWSATLVVAVAALGFLPAVVLAWASEAPRSAPEAETPDRHSIAVLPFANFSGDAENEYFSDGMTEELIDRLAKVQELRVAARTSSFAFKGRNEDMAGIGRQLRVAHVLEGSVRRSGSRLRVTAQLIEVASGFHLWSQTYERELSDVFAIQDEIGRAIAEVLQVKLVGGGEAPLQHGAPASLQAYDLYLKARYLLNRRSAAALRSAIEHFELAIACDPRHARSYAGLAQCWLILASGTHGLLAGRDALERARSSAEKALALDDTLAEGHTSLGLALLHAWDWSGAEARLSHAIELDPADAVARHQHAWLLALTGELDGALAGIERALELDPLSLPIHTARGRILQFMRRPDDALAEYRRTLELDPTFAGAHLSMGLALLQGGRHGEAVAALRHARELSDTPGAAALVAYALAAGGDEAAARAVLRSLLERAARQYVSPANLASVYAALGDYDDAFAWYERACQQHDHGLVYLKVEPLLDPLRTDPRFGRLLERVGLAGARPDVIHA